MSVIIDGNEIVLSGMVGGEADGDGFWFADGFSASDVINALAQVGRGTDVTVRLNSGGGIATEGAAIHAAFTAHKGKVTVMIEGVAASAASLLAMAGDTIVMMPGAVMMIHDPAGFTFGDVEDHQKTIEALNVLGNAYAGIYAERSGKTVEQARELMKAETWMTGPEAVAAGFADSVGAGNDNEAEPTAFAYGVYAKAPERFVALANARGWKPRAALAAPSRRPLTRPPQGEAAASDRRKEPTMTDMTTAGQQTAPEKKPDATTVDPVANAASIAAICAGFMNADQIASFITNGGTVEKAKARATEVGEIRAAVAQARTVQPQIEAKVADEFIAQGRSLSEVRDALFKDLVAKQSPEVSPHVAAGATTPGKPAAKIDHRAIYDRMNGITK